MHLKKSENSFHFKKGSTAMHLAARDGSKEVLQFLITNGFDKDVRTPVSYYPLLRQLVVSCNIERRI